MIAGITFFVLTPDKESTNGAFDYCEAQAKYVAEHKLEAQNFLELMLFQEGLTGKQVPQEVRNKSLGASPAANAFRYQSKIKKMLDPNDLGDGYVYLDGRVTSKHSLWLLL